MQRLQDDLTKIDGVEEGRPRPQFTITTTASVHDVYRGAVEGKDIQDFLKNTDIYDTFLRKWRIPELPGSTEEVAGAVFRVFSAIVERFARPTTSGVERNVVNGSEIRQAGHGGGSETEKIPALIVQAAGPSFQLPRTPTSMLGSTPSGENVGYSNIASCSAVKLDSAIGTSKENVEEMEAYARHIFQVQPNRSFVRSLVVTEKHARLVHFDRSGPQITPLMDIHQHPETLVRLIVGLSSTSERLLGLDDSVQWTIVDGKKTQGYITTTSPTGEAKSYPIVRQLPVPRHSVCSRGTTCWIVRDPETHEHFVVKDSWREDDLAAEHELLERVKDIRGVVHMVSCEPYRGETKTFRCVSTIGRYKNRKASRVLLKRYGKAVEYFSSALQVLCAFRDAILGHQQLVERGILHRDVSLNNILLGRPCAPEGERGVLIDLDLAFLVTEENRTVKADHAIGTHLFQPISVLWSRELCERAWDHDYLEDLEAFVYSLAFIFLCYLPDGSLVPANEEGPSIPWSWADETPTAARESKFDFFGVGTIASGSSRIVRKAWGPICGTLFTEFRRWVFQMRGQKNSLIARAAGATEPLKAFHSHRSEHYGTVIRMFDDAIAGLLSSQVSPLQSPSAGHSQEGSVSTSLKPDGQNVSQLTGPLLVSTKSTLPDCAPRKRYLVTESSLLEGPAGAMAQNLNTSDCALAINPSDTAGRVQEPNDPLPSPVPKVSTVEYYTPVQKRRRTTED